MKSQRLDQFNWGSFIPEGNGCYLMETFGELWELGPQMWRAEEDNAFG